MGGEASGCSETTTDVLIESALWEPLNIAQTGRKLGINSDARYRFERGVDPNFMLPGLELATRMVLDLCGGTPSAVMVAGKVETPQHVIDFPLAEVARLSGLSASLPEIEHVLERLGFGVAGQGEIAEGHGAVVAARRARQGRYRRGDRAHPRRRPRAGDAVRSRRRAAQADPHLDPDAHPQGQARAGGARHGRGGDLVVRLQGAGRTVRRRPRPSWRSPIRSRPISRTCGRACCPACWRRRSATPTVVSPTSRCSRSGRSFAATGRRIRRPPRAACGARSPSRAAAAATGRARSRRSMRSTPRPMRSRCWPPRARRWRRCRSCRAARPGFIPAAAARFRSARRTCSVTSANCIRASWRRSRPRARWSASR